MKIYLSTLGRLHKQETLERFPAALRKEVIMVVQDHEYHDHVREYSGVVKEIRSLPPYIKTLGPTRKEIVEWKEDEKIVLLDDDLTFYRRRADDDWRLRLLEDHEYAELFSLISRKLDDYVHVGISGREGNNRFEPPFVESTRYMRVLAYNLANGALEVEHGRVDGMSDFDVNLQLLRKGYPSCILTSWAQGHKATQQPGGCTINRTHSTHEAEIAKMVGWHGDFVRVRQKQNKGGGDFGTRQELTIYWKKALDSASQN